MMQILMYMATKSELEPIRPLSKFLCIKMVIFASYWQGVFIGILVHLGIIHTGEWTTYSNPKDIGAGLQDFLICIEMFIAALAHAYAFPPRDYMDMNTWHGPGFTGNLRRMFDMRDVVDDTTLVANDLVSSTAQGLTNVRVCRLFAHNGLRVITSAQQAGRSTLQAARYTMVDKPRSVLGKMFSRGCERKRDDGDPHTASLHSLQGKASGAGTGAFATAGAAASLGLPSTGGGCPKVHFFSLACHRVNSFSVGPLTHKNTQTCFGFFHKQVNKPTRLPRHPTSTQPWHQRL